MRRSSYGGRKSCGCVPGRDTDSVLEMKKQGCGGRENQNLFLQKLGKVPEVTAAMRDDGFSLQDVHTLCSCHEMGVLQIEDSHTHD